MSIEIQSIINHFLQLGFDCFESEAGGGECICVKVELADKQLTLAYFPTKEITGLPAFFLLEPEHFDQLAHVLIREVQGIKLGWVCVNDKDSISVNFSMPLMAIEESLFRHISLLEKAMTDPDWNRYELLREFYSNWSQLCGFGGKSLLLTDAKPELQNLDVYAPALNKDRIGTNAFYLVEPSQSEISPIASLSWRVEKNNRRIAGKALLIPLEVLEPAPMNTVNIAQWLTETISNFPAGVLTTIKQRYSGTREKEYWLVFTAQTPSGRTWFAIHLQSKKKKRPLPLTSENLQKWKVAPVHVQVFDREKVIPRGGGNVELSGEKVALIGAGSVGCEIAHKLSSAGVEDLDIYDPDIYSIDNLYRHILPHNYLNFSKSRGIEWFLHNQFPWSKARSGKEKLLDLRDKQYLENYDLIIVAVGSPTHERLFKQYLIDSKVSVPVIYTWLEGFGVGGHAVLDIPDSKGCLLCAYVCQESLKRGLNPNLSFIEANQNVTKNMAGCGDQYISYGAICSAQTALIATDLAIRYLEKRIHVSSKVSWKGSDHEAIENNILLTHRYYAFNDSLKILPLVDEDCDVCSEI